MSETREQQARELAQQRKEVIDYSILMENMGLSIDWIKIAERLERLERAAEEGKS